LLDEKLDKLLSNVLEFIMLSVSFRAFETRSCILDFRFVEKSFVAFIGFVSVANTFTNEKVKIDNILSTITI